MKLNQYDQKCCICGMNVKAGEGFFSRSSKPRPERLGEWDTYHVVDCAEEYTRIRGYQAMKKPAKQITSRPHHSESLLQF